MTLQLITKDGQPEWAVIPYEQYQHFLEAMEMLEDIEAFDAAHEAISLGEELIPSHVTYAILDGENPIAVWRTYRGLSQAELAQKAGIGVGLLAELETGHLVGDEGMLSRVAEALNLELEDITQPL